MDKLKAVSNCSDSLTKAPTADNNLSILNTKVNVKNAYAAFKIRQNEDILESRIQLKHASSNIFSDSDKGNLCQKTSERSYTFKLHYNGIGEDELWHVNTTAWCGHGQMTVPPGGLVSPLLFVSVPPLSVPPLLFLSARALAVPLVATLGVVAVTIPLLVTAHKQHGLCQTLSLYGLSSCLLKHYIKRFPCWCLITHKSPQ